MNDELTNTFLHTIKKTLAEYLGLMTEDISEDDSFVEDLHMQPTEFADYLQELKSNGMETDDLNLSSIQTVGDLVESLSSHIYTA